MASVRGAADDVAAIAVSDLCPDLVPVDAQGRALRPAILYGIDTRASLEIANLEGMRTAYPHTIEDVHALARLGHAG